MTLAKGVPCPRANTTPLNMEGALGREGREAEMKLTAGTCKRAAYWPHQGSIIIILVIIIINTANGLWNPDLLVKITRGG